MAPHTQDKLESKDGALIHRAHMMATRMLFVFLFALLIAGPPSTAQERATCGRLKVGDISIEIRGHNKNEPKLFAEKNGTINSAIELPVMGAGFGCKSLFATESGNHVLLEWKEGTPGTFHFFYRETLNLFRVEKGGLNLVAAWVLRSGSFGRSQPGPGGRLLNKVEFDRHYRVEVVDGEDTVVIEGNQRHRLTDFSTECRGIFRFPPCLEK